MGALLSDRSLAWMLVCLIAAYLVVLAAKPTWSALAAIGPNPSEGGRFYGSSNLTTSILLTIAALRRGDARPQKRHPGRAAFDRDRRLEPSRS